MAGEGTIEIGATTLDTPIGYTHDPDKMESYDRAIKGNLITNRSLTDEDQPISLYRFEVSDIVNSKMLAIKAEAAHIGNLDYIDNLQIAEVLSGDGATTYFYTQRRMSADTPVPVVTLGGVAKTVTVTNAINPAAGNVYAKADVSGRARFIFGDIPPDVDNNIIIEYEPKFYVHIISLRYSGIIKDVANYTLICEESK